jgi:1,4-dihydroxy-2-naphthoate octaprenyltransferase
MNKLNIISWFDKSTVKHLRLPFSFFLMPVFLFALSQATIINWGTTILSFVILHLFIFPSSNGYNSYQDRDETSIGGLKDPPKVTENLFYATLFLDITGVLCALFVSIYFSIFVFIFVLMSRAYSYRNVRLKKYPIIGFLTVFIFQGAFVYLMASSAIVNSFSFQFLFTFNNILCMCVASLFMGSIYPLTQIYQHEADKKDGVISISYKLGYIGTFIFSSILIALATICLYYYYTMKHQQIALILFAVLMLPVVVNLSLWFNKVRRSTKHANFENTMTMNLLTSTCMNLYFLVLILNNHYIWF